MIELLNSDCMEYMRHQPDSSFQLGSADPPYFKGVGKLGYLGKNQSSIGVKRGKYNIPSWDNSLPDNIFFEELKRVSADQIIWGANYYDFITEPHTTPRRNEIEKWIADHPIGWIIWDKYNGKSDFNDYELAWTSFDQPTRIFTFLWNGMLQGKSLSEPTTVIGNKRLNQKRIHPTQKPTHIYRWLFKEYATGSILETHGGSMSAAIAAHQLNIDIIVCEKDIHYYTAGCKRFKEQTAQQQLF